MNTLPQISEAEFEVMKIIWKYAPISTNEITEKLLQTTNWSPKTIQTLIKRLVTKGALTYEKQSRMFVYTPVVKESEYIGQESSSFLNRYYDGDITAMVSAYIGELKGENLYSILCDDYMALKEMTDLVFSKGCQSPIYLYRTLNYSGQKKRQGFLDSCLEHGISAPESRVFCAPFGLHKSCDLLEHLSQTQISFDCVLTADDELAAGAVKYAFKKHLRIPEDFQVTGYNNSVLSACSTPEITTVDNRVEYMCVTAVSQMMQVFQKESLPSRTMFSGSIVEKQTTKQG